ncbi:BA14K family protein [Rhizobium herbae]|uniref:Lectin-like protein BA14k n=1 Tax=Rhizobium herbae TaxID=508661 RepID=A0ABS7HF29_9HYPH|nr:BA14K family protein [Rhizobium herbae]MBW9065891.1 BA14K family protein [Rhizobium herbae]
MKEVLLPLTRIALLLTPFVGSLAAISSILPEPKPHNFHNINTPSLWTVNPVKVDRSAQQFERVPPVSVRPQEVRHAQAAADDGRKMQAMNAAGLDKAAVDRTLVTGAVEGPTDADRQAALEWCRNRYRSYRPADNSYQPYHGPRRPCQPPFVARSDANDGTPLAGEATTYGNDMHAQWCAARYRSYNARDNTYHSYDGRRRTCRSPNI